MNDAVYEVVVHKILANLLLRAAAIHDPGEADDCGGAARRKPGKRMHDEGEIRL